MYAYVCSRMYTYVYSSKIKKEKPSIKQRQTDRYKNSLTEKQPKRYTKKRQIGRQTSIEIIIAGLTP